MLRRPHLRRRPVRGLTRTVLGTLLAAATLAACASPPGSATDSGAGHAGHDQQTVRVMTALEQERDMEFRPAGPHHDVGRGPSGVELDLIGVPVEQVILSIPADDPELGLAYLPYVRDLLHGPDRVYDWVAAMLACRASDAAACDDDLEQGNLAARFTDGGPDYVVVSLVRGP